MALDDFVETEVGVAVAATAIALSPAARAWIRRGLVLGLAGVMKAADTVGGAARNVAGEAQNAVSSAVSDAQSTASQSRTTRSRTSSNAEK